MEDTLITINTGYGRLRDGTAIERAAGKMYLVRKEWRVKMDKIVAIIEDIRRQFLESLGLNEMLFNYMRGQDSFSRNWSTEQAMNVHFRADFPLGEYINERRKKAVNIMNTLLKEIGYTAIVNMD